MSWWRQWRERRIDKRMKLHREMEDFWAWREQVFEMRRSWRARGLR